MEELMRTTDPVLISFVESELKAFDIHFLILDTHTSILEGSIGAIPRRILVERANLTVARRILTDAGVGEALR